MTEEMPSYRCKRIKNYVLAEKAEDATGKVYVQCKHYTGADKNPCNHDIPNFKKCLVKLAVLKEKRKLISLNFTKKII